MGDGARARRRIQEDRVGCESTIVGRDKRSRRKRRAQVTRRAGSRIKMAGKITANAHTEARQSASPARVDESIPRDEASSWCCRYTWASSRAC